MTLETTRVDTDAGAQQLEAFRAGQVPITRMVFDPRDGEPTVLIDARGRPDIRDLPRVYGDAGTSRCATRWRALVRGNGAHRVPSFYLFLEVHFTRPVECRFYLEFDPWDNRFLLYHIDQRKRLFIAMPDLNVGMSIQVNAADLADIITTLDRIRRGNPDRCPPCGGTAVERGALNDGPEFRAAA